MRTAVITDSGPGFCAPRGLIQFLFGLAASLNRLRARRITAESSEPVICLLCFSRNWTASSEEILNGGRAVGSGVGFFAIGVSFGLLPRWRILQQKTAVNDGCFSFRFSGIIAGCRAAGVSAVPRCQGHQGHGQPGMIVPQLR